MLELPEDIERNAKQIELFPLLWRINQQKKR